MIHIKSSKIYRTKIMSYIRASGRNQAWIARYGNTVTQDNLHRFEYAPPGERTIVQAENRRFQPSEKRRRFEAEMIRKNRKYKTELCKVNKRLKLVSGPSLSGALNFHLSGLDISLLSQLFFTVFSQLTLSSL